MNNKTEKSLSPNTWLTSTDDSEQSVCAGIPALNFLNITAD